MDINGKGIIMKKLVVFIDCELLTFSNDGKKCSGIVHLDDHPDSFSDENLKQAAISVLHSKFSGIPASHIKNVHFNQISTLTSYEDEE